MTPVVMPAYFDRTSSLRAATSNACAIGCPPGRFIVQGFAARLLTPSHQWNLAAGISFAQSRRFCIAKR